jgi:plasmid replication initiation protein
MKNSLVVSKSNQLARTGNNLTLSEARMVEYCLSTLYMDDIVTSDTLLEIDVEAMGKHFNISRSNAYRELKQAFRNIASKRLIFTVDAEGWTIDTSWISAVYFNDTLDGIRLRFSQDILPHISGDKIKTNFTAYRLEDIAKFKSNYSIVLYNLFKSYAYKAAGYRVCITLEELRTLLDIKPEEYKLFGDLNRVIKKCIAEIETNTELYVSVDLKKRGKEVYSLIFIMTPKTTTGN